MNKPLPKVKVSKKAPKNDAALKSLKSQGYRVKIEHFRRDFCGLEHPDAIISDKPGHLLKNIWNLCYAQDINLFGGSTKMTLTKGNDKIEIMANCFWKDRFCRKNGVRACLDKLETLHGIKA